MKYLLAILFIIFNSTLYCIKNRYSETFLYTRPVYNRLTAYEAFWENIVYYEDHNANAYGQIIGLYQKSSLKDEDINQYFLMRGKNQLTVKGDDVTQIDRDIRAEWLDLPANFNGEFSLYPQQTQFGAVFVATKDIKGLINWDFLNNWWVGFFIPVSVVQNRLHLSQSFVASATTSPHNILESLARPDIIFNKMLDCSSTAGFSEIRLMAGARFQTTNVLQLATRSSIIFPLGNKYNACQMFEAIRGFNGHLGWETVINSQFQINCDDACKILFYADFSNIFFFSNKQRRTVDLMNKPYSRYLLLCKNTGQTNIPAINILTPEFKVKTHNIADISAGFRIKKGRLEAQVGYNLWARGTEKLELAQHWDNSYGICALGVAPQSDGTPATASKSTISEQAAADVDSDGDLVFESIEVGNLDFDSGASRSTITNSIDGVIGYVHDGPRIAGFVGVGGFVELPMNNCALKQWGFWFKLGASI